MPALVAATPRWGYILDFRTPEGTERERGREAEGPTGRVGAHRRSKCGRAVPALATHGWIGPSWPACGGPSDDQAGKTLQQGRRIEPEVLGRRANPGTDPFRLMRTQKPCPPPPARSQVCSRKRATQHLPALTTLPFHHRDPFDRLIVCQAMAENMAVCTGDSHFRPYPIRLVW